MFDTAIWLIIFVVCLVIESQSVELLAIWFSAGALVAMVASLLGAEIWLQVVLFVVISGILLAALRPLVKKFIKPRITPTNIDAIIGTQGYITTDVDNLNATGEVKLGALTWTARSTDGNPLPAGTLVQVDRIEGVKVFVTAVKAEEKV